MAKIRFYWTESAKEKAIEYYKKNPASQVIRMVTDSTEYNYMSVIEAKARIAELQAMIDIVESGANETLEVSGHTIYPCERCNANIAVRKD